MLDVTHDRGFFFLILGFLYCFSAPLFPNIFVTQNAIIITLIKPVQSQDLSFPALANED